MADYYFDKKTRNEVLHTREEGILKITKKNDKKTMYKNTKIPNPRI